MFMIQGISVAIYYFKKWIKKGSIKNDIYVSIIL